MMNLTNITSFVSLAYQANTNTGGWFWAGMLFMLFMILFISMITFGFEVALLGAAFSCLMIGILMATIDLVAWTWVATFAGVIIFVFLWTMFFKRD